MPALLYVCVRPQRDAGDAEYASFRSAMALDTDALVAHDLVAGPLPRDAADRYAGVVVGGSPFNVCDPASAKTSAQLRVESELAGLAESAASGRIPALFTCYGIGVVTRTLGGEVDRSHPEDTGPVEIELTPDAAADPLFSPLDARFHALTAHKEATAVVPPGATVLATGRVCPVQAYRVGDRLYATQFHPEPTTRAFTERMTIYRNDGYFDALDYDLVAGRVMAASVTEPPRMLRRFAELFGGV